jgi:hypothetical protein
MRSAMRWIVFGVYLALGTLMICFGVIFIRNAYFSLYLSKGEVAFSSLLLGVILLMVGGGLVCSTIARSLKRVWAR